MASSAKTTNHSPSAFGLKMLDQSYRIIRENTRRFIFRLTYNSLMVVFTFTVNLLFSSKLKVVILKNGDTITCYPLIDGAFLNFIPAQ